MTFSAKELTALEEQLGAEQVLVKKYTQYANNSNDSVLKQKYTAIADKHRCHYNKLLSYFN